ncbi:hypothetical protein K227x_62600 [Rubripirellula lacrimiformis]|uniref:Aerotolerance regulator N-terminal domain-containing protein n=1 Tax=Rubripirellula lacrimiformis TaxID=1930273 RepID=A0A517NL31_9BACT|nr:BatA domain-containing protein [Rubripirellula lacrimiformis]QDT07831.1 hypothetical protein K227x_62600 [Rubripirellula lacrimiformis]
MSFLNATLIFGSLAAIIPIVLHLIARREPRKVVFPSVAFLTRRVDSHRSRMRVRRWWLLALRIAAVAALAFALARPAIHQSLSLTWLTIGLVGAAGLALLVMASIAISKGQSRNVSVGLVSGAAAALLFAGVWGAYTYASGPAVSLDTTDPVALAIVLDNSPTSALRSTGDGRSSGDQVTRMQEVAAWMVSRLPATSRVAVLDRSSAPAVFSLDVGGAISKIEQTSVRQVVQPITQRVDAAARLLRTSDLTNRQILIITDLATSTWGDSVSEVAADDTYAADPPIGVTVYDVGAIDATNRHLSMPRIADATPPMGTPVPITATLSQQTIGQVGPADAGDQAAVESSGGGRTVTVELELFERAPSLPVVRDGKVVYPAARSVDRTSVRLIPGSSSDLLLTIPSLSLGVHHGRIRLTGNDSMPLDDARYFSVSVLPPASVLLVSDDTDEAAAIAKVITVSATIADDANAEFQVERIGHGDLRVARLSDYDAIVLLDPPIAVLSDPTIAEYVAGGGGVLVSLGPAAGDTALESTFMPPLVLRWRVPDEGTFLQASRTRHPVTEAVSEDTPWSDFWVHQYWQVSPAPGDRVLMRYAGTDHPALIGRRVAIPPKSGDVPADSDPAGLPAAGSETGGSVLVLTTPVPALAKSTRSWNELFGTDPWPAFVLIRQSIEFLTGRSQNGAMTLVGRPYAVRVPDANADAETGAAESSNIALGTNTGTIAGTNAGGGPGSTDVGPAAVDASLATRSTRLQVFPPDGRLPVPLDKAAAADSVVVADVSVAGTYWVRGSSPGLGFSANLPDNAFNFDRVDADRLDQVLGADRYQLATTRDEIEMSDQRSASRVSLHSPAMLLALIVFLLEQVLGNRFYRTSSRKSQPAAV